MKLEIIIPIAAVLLIYTARLVELNTKRDVIRGPVKENTTLRLFMLSGTAMLVCSIAEFLWTRSQLWWPDFIGGCLAAVLSIALRKRAIAALGKFWSLHVEIRENHQFVRSGPFQWVRHPTYFSMILELLAIGLILNARFSFILAAAIFIPALYWRIKIEERALVEKFGPAYQQYQSEVPALLPYKWPTAK